jgi:hypothetical protein
VTPALNDPCQTTPGWPIPRFWPRPPSACTRHDEHPTVTGCCRST